MVDCFDYDDMDRGDPVRVLMTEPGDASSDIVISQTSSDIGTQIDDDIFRGIRRWRPGGPETLRIRNHSNVTRAQSLVWSRDEIILRAMTCVADHGLLAVVAGTELLLLDAATGVDVLRKELGAEGIAVAARGDRIAVTTRMGTLRMFELSG